MTDLTLLSASSTEASTTKERSQAAVAQDLFVFGKRTGGTAQDLQVTLKHATLLLGKRGEVSAEAVQTSMQQLQSFGIKADQLKLVYASRDNAEGGKDTHLAISMDGLDGKKSGKPVIYSDLCDYLEAQGILKHEMRAASDARVSYEHRPFLQRLKQDGIGGTLKYYWKEAPIKLIGTMYLFGDGLETATGVVNSRESLYSKRAQIVQGLGFSAGSMVMFTHGGRKDGLSLSEGIMQQWQGDIAGSEIGKTLGYLQDADDQHALQKVDTMMAKNASELGKGFNFAACYALLQTAIQQENPYKLAQFAFSQVGFGLSTFTPKRGVEFEDTRLGSVLAKTPLRPLIEPAFHFLQDNPNISILSVLGHNFLGFRSGFLDIQRSDTHQPTDAERAERQGEINERNELISKGKTGLGRFIPNMFRPKPLQDNPFEIRERFADARFQVIDHMSVSDTGVVQAERSAWHHGDEKKYKSKSPEQVLNLLNIAKSGWAVLEGDAGVPRAPTELELEQLAPLAGSQKHHKEGGAHFVRTQTDALPMPNGKELEHFESRVDYYMMLQQLRKTAIPWMFSVAWYAITNTAFAFVKPKQEPLEPEALYSNAAQELLQKLDAQKPEAVQEYTLLATASHLSEWLSEHPEVKYARKKNVIALQEGETMFEHLFKHISTTAQHIAIEMGEPEKAAAICRHLQGDAIWKALQPTGGQDAPAIQPQQDVALSQAVMQTQSSAQQQQTDIARGEVARLGFEKPEMEEISLKP